MSEHVDSIKTYSAVWIVLLVLTAVTTAVAYVDLGPFSVVVALVIAFCKMLLVALFFMHIRHSTRLTRLVVAGALVWLAIMLAFTMADIMTRAW
jgi:cytochrome c oxidase subunit IV